MLVEEEQAEESTWEVVDRHDLKKKTKVLDQHDSEKADEWEMAQEQEKVEDFGLLWNIPEDLFRTRR